MQVKKPPKPAYWLNHVAGKAKDCMLGTSQGLGEKSWQAHLGAVIVSCRDARDRHRLCQSAADVLECTGFLVALSIFQFPLKKQV